MKPGSGATLLRRVRWAFVAAVCVAYPVLAHLAASDPVPTLANAAVALVAPLGLALIMAWRSPHRSSMLLLWTIGCATLYGLSGWLVQHYNWIFLLQDTGMQLLLALAFGRTLRADRVPLVSRFAASLHGRLSPALQRYTRQVTWAWTLYFSTMATLSLLLFWQAPIAIWSAFANLLALPLLVLMFAAEYAARLYFLIPSDRAGPIEAIRAYRRASSGGLPPSV